MKNKAGKLPHAIHSGPPTPLLNPKTPVKWFFLFKLNSAEARGDPKPPGMRGIFDIAGWERPDYEKDGKKYSQHYLFASSRHPGLQRGRGILGAIHYDPLGATFCQTYFGPHYYVIWNDQFYNDPLPTRASPWGHSKGVLTWNEEGEGYVMQVSTPSWPGAGNHRNPRETDGNTLGFIDDDDVEVSQHFYALKLNKPDLIKVLAGLQNASVVTDINDRQLVHNGGPPEVRALVKSLGRLDKDKEATIVELSTGVKLISKPSKLCVPPWQLVSAKLGSVDMRVASWWANPKIYSTSSHSATPKCWGDLPKPGAVEIATSGSYKSRKHPVKNVGLTGGSGSIFNHAKFGVSTSEGSQYTVFGDLNQQGTLKPGVERPTQTCCSSQNGRGGLFYVMDNQKLWESVSSLLEGDSAPVRRPRAKKKLNKKAKTR